MQILGIHSAGHDTGVSVWEDGRLLFATETERVTRRRHDHEVAAALQTLFELPWFDPAAVDHVAVSTEFRQRLVGVDDHENVRRSISERQLHVETYCSLLGRRLPCTVVAHEASHAALSLHYSGYDATALILVNEGRGSFSRNSLFDYDGSSLHLIESDSLPWYASGLGWSAIGHLAGYGDGPGVAGKVMALGGFGTPQSRLGDAILSVDPGFANASMAARQREGARLMKICNLADFDNQAALVSSFQQLFTDEVIRTLRTHLASGRFDRLALGGGCALNIVTNSELRRLLNIPIAIPPACNDAGHALGAAIYAQRFVLGICPLPFSIYAIGSPETAAETRTVLDAAAIPQRDYCPDLVARRLAEGAVVAFAHGAAESGPRALGNRSLLASPKISGMKQRVSERVKGREWFRPLAPVMRAETFAAKRPGEALSPHMLYNYDVDALDLPEAAHVDATARVQTVSAQENPKLHDLLDRFERIGGGNGLINTSLNAGGKPIAQTARDVLDDFWASDVDLFVFGDVMVDRFAEHR